MGQKTERMLDRAKANLEDDNHENALRLFNEILNREPGHLQALRSKALIKITLGKRSEAEKFLLFAIEQQPLDDQLYQMLGTFYLNNDEPQKALAPLKRATEINASSTMAHYGLGLIYGKFQGDQQKAIAHFSAFIDGSVPSADAHFNRACSYLILNKKEKAEADFRKAAELNHPTAKEMLKEFF